MYAYHILIYTFQKDYALKQTRQPLALTFIYSHEYESVCLSEQILKM